MKKKSKKNIKKKVSRKRRIKAKKRKNGHDKSVDLQKIINFKFQTLSKVYENFKEKRKKEKIKKDKLKNKNREKQIQEEQREL